MYNVPLRAGVEAPKGAPEGCFGATLTPDKYLFTGSVSSQHRESKALLKIMHVSPLDNSTLPHQTITPV